MKSTATPIRVSRFDCQALDSIPESTTQGLEDHRWSDIIPPETGLTFAVIWDPEDGLLAFSGAELLGSSTNYLADSPISPSEACDNRSQVLTLGTFSSANMTPATLAFFRDTHQYLFAGSRAHLDSSRKFKQGTRTQTSSTIGGVDVYLRGSLLGQVHQNYNHYSCFDLLEEGLEVRPLKLSDFTDLQARNKEAEGFERRYNGAFSILQDEHNLSSRFSTTTTSTSSYISVGLDVDDDDFASRTWSVLERPNTPTVPLSMRRHGRCKSCRDLYFRGSQRLRKCRPKDGFDIPTPPAEVLQRPEYNHEVKMADSVRQRTKLPASLLRGLSGKWKKGTSCSV